MGPPKTNPLWFDFQTRKFPRLTAAQIPDVVIVGGGITGLSAAYHLKRSGKTVCVLERDRLGSGDTGHTTAHLTCVTDVRLKQLVSAFGKEEAALVWHAGMNAIETIERTVSNLEINCQFRRVPGFLHEALFGDVDESEELREETELARELGFDAAFVPSVPIVAKPGMRISNQAKFRPLEYLNALAEFIDGDGSAVYEHTEVSEIEDDPLVVVANDVRVECDHVVIATHVPLMGKASLLSASLFQTKLAPYSSYVVSARLPQGTLPEVSLWDTSDPYFYLRVDKEPELDRVIFGGNDHKTGQTEDTRDHFSRLEQSLHSILPHATVEHRWSGQVIETNDGVPYIGEIADRQFIATGFSGNGITFGTAAALLIRDSILNKDNPLKDLFAVQRKKLRGGAWDYFKENLDYPYYLISDWLTPAKAVSPESIPRGEGAIIKIDGHKVACAHDRHGKLHQVSAVCTHLGCIVHFNQAEQTWDCPCHGSRFSLSGDVIAGPAESPLDPVTHEALAKTTKE